MPNSSARAALSALALAIALVPGGAVRAEENNNGFKFGDARLHPFFDLELRFDSAAFAAPSAGSSTSYDIPGDLLIHFRPGLKLEMPTSSFFNVNLNGNVDYILYTGIINSGTRSASYLAADADLDVGVNREGQFGVDLGDHFVRTDHNTSTPTLGIGALSLYNDARIKLNIRPYSGSITIEPGYHFTAEFFSPQGDEPDFCTVGNDSPICNPKQLSMLNYINHDISLNGRWKFLPKTAMTLDSTFGIRQYTETGAGAGTDIMSLKAALGLAGLFTSHINLLLRVGWGQDFTAQSYSSVIGQAEFGYLFSETASIRVGYVRTFEPVGPPYISFGDDRGYVEGRLLLGGKLSLKANVAFDWLQFHGQAATTTTTATPDKSQANLSLDLGIGYEIKSWVNIGGGYVLTYMNGTNVYAGLSSFTRNEGYLKVEFIY
jgi:hypothetical protein